jgi:hypothetical protein
MRKEYMLEKIGWGKFLEHSRWETENAQTGGVKADVTDTVCEGGSRHINNTTSGCIDNFLSTDRGRLYVVRVHGLL